MLIRSVGVAAVLAAAVVNYLPATRALRALPDVVRLVDENDGQALLDASGGWITSDASVAVDVNNNPPCYRTLRRKGKRKGIKTPPLLDWVNVIR